MKHLINEMGVENVVMGTDYPFPWNTAPVDHILSIPDITDADKIAILGGTAAKLLGIRKWPSPGDPRLTPGSPPLSRNAGEGRRPGRIPSPACGGRMPSRSDG